MSKYPLLKPNQVVSILQKLGFVEVRQKGSHKQFRHSDGRCTTIPFHKGRDLSPIIVRQITKDINISLDDFYEKF